VWPAGTQVSRGAADLRRVSRALTRVAILAAFLFVAGGCSAGQHRPPAAGTVLRVTERDFRILAPKRVSSNQVRLSVHNRGPDAHELIVVRARNSHLPLRPDGSTVDEDALERATVGVLEAGAPGSVRQLLLHLRPGRYMLICNMSGHFLGGMHTELVVR
jgi:hypothetical protein